MTKMRRRERDGDGLACKLSKSGL